MGGQEQGRNIREFSCAEKSFILSARMPRATCIHFRTIALSPYRRRLSSKWDTYSHDGRTLSIHPCGRRLLRRGAPQKNVFDRYETTTVLRKNRRLRSFFSQCMSRQEQGAGFAQKIGVVFTDCAFTGATILRVKDEIGAGVCGRGGPGPVIRSNAHSAEGRSKAKIG